MFTKAWNRLLPLNRNISWLRNVFCFLTLCNVFGPGEMRDHHCYVCCGCLDSPPPPLSPLLKWVINDTRAFWRPLCFPRRHLGFVQQLRQRSSVLRNAQIFNFYHPPPRVKGQLCFCQCLYICVHLSAISKISHESLNRF